MEEAQEKEVKGADVMIYAPTAECKLSVVKQEEETGLDKSNQ